MKFSEISSSITEHGTYRSVIVEIGKATKYRILQVVGKLNYVEICKLTNNPFGGVIGTEYSDFNEAQAHYRNPSLKTAILMAEQMFAEHKVSPENKRQFLNALKADQDRVLALVEAGKPLNAIDDRKYAAIVAVRKNIKSVIDFGFLKRKSIRN